jgi:hypothetical protein
MKIRLEEYVGASRVRLSVDDAPMTALSRLVETFVTALDEVSEKQKAARPFGLVPGLTEAEQAEREQYFGDKAFVFGVSWPEPTQQATAEAMADNLPGDDTIDCTRPEEPPKKRGRPRKVETALESAPPLYQGSGHALDLSEPVATEAPEEPSLPFEPATNAEDTSEISTLASAESASRPPSDEPPPAESPAEPLAEITDSEMNRYCGKLAQHWGGAEKVYALAQKFVNEGELPRPTRIAGTEARWAFIREAETATGVKYHG